MAQTDSSDEEKLTEILTELGEKTDDSKESKKEVILNKPEYDINDDVDFQCDETLSDEEAPDVDFWT